MPYLIKIPTLGFRRRYTKRNEKGYKAILGNKSEAKRYKSEQGAKSAINQLEHIYPKLRGFFEIVNVTE